MTFATRHGLGRLLALATPDVQTIAEAYVYLLGRALVIRQEHVDLDQTGVDYNVIKYTPLGTADFVNPNLDMACVEAWFAVDERTPVMLEVPEIINRYYTVQIINEWGEVIANINERTFPSQRFGTFALVKPGCRVKTPADAARIVLHSSKAKMLARIELKQDRDGAVRLQKQFQATATGNPSIMPASPLPMFGNRELIGVEIFGGADDVLTTALDVSPDAAALQQKVRLVARYASSGREARLDVEGLLRDRVIPDFNGYAVKRSAIARNNWLSSPSASAGTGGTFGADYRLRTAVNLMSMWANTPDEMLSFQTTRDANGKALNGTNAYMMHFQADQLPGMVVNAYWSLILLSVPSNRVAPNPLGRFTLNSYSRLTTESDGSLKLAVAPTPVTGVPESNWLPSPDGGLFSLTFRAYVAKDVVKRGEWFPPPLVLAY